ncbi:MAG: indolepyruvate oxidoreductase subunit beta [Promethearchaeota archaeon]
MKEYNLLFTGVGGTGVVTAARIVATAAIAEGLNVRVGEIHGMSQRLGAVTSTVRIGDSVHGSIIPPGKADLILTVELIEALRCADRMNTDGTFIVGMLHMAPTAVLLDRATYPSDEEVLNELKKYASVVTVDAVRLARDAGSVMSVNIVLVGSAFGLGKIPLKEKAIISALKEVLRPRYHEVNIKAFELGMKAVAGT